MFLNKSNRLAIVDFDGTKISHTELVNLSIYYSNNILNNIKEREFNLIFMENRKEWLYSFYGIWNKKSPVVVIDATSSSDELAYFLTDSGAFNIVVSKNTLEVAKEAILKSKREINLINVDEIIIDDKKLKETEKIDEELKHPIDDNVAVMLYTSGTTGSPKGVMLSFNNIIHEIDSIDSLQVFELESEQVLAALPFHHILPLMTNNFYFLYYKKQHSLVLIDKLSSQEILKALNENNVTFMVFVPRVYKLFYKSLKDIINGSFLTRTLYNIAAKLKSKTFSKIIFKKVHQRFGGKIRHLISGGAKSDPEMIEFFENLGFSYCEGYGLTETSPLISGGTPKHGKKIGTTGRVVDNLEYKSVDGELWVKGPTVMKGYYNKPEKTAEVITEDGWFKTGDLVEIDEEGYITILGRKNTMIVLSNGKNVDPETLENKFFNVSTEVVKETAIFGYKDKLVALIVVDKEEILKKNISNVHAHIKDIVEFYNGSVHNYEKILEYKITEEELPKTRLSKTRRFMLKDIYEGNETIKKDIKIEEPSSDSYKILKKFIYDIKGEYAHPEKNLELEFGLDSLDQVELLTFIENSYGIKMEENVFKENLSLKLLSEYIDNHNAKYVESSDQWKEIINKAPLNKLKEGLLFVIIKPIIWILFKLYFRIKIEGKDKFTDKPQIFIANHESFVDALAFSLLIPNKLAKKTYSLAIDWYFKNSFMKFVANNGNILLLDIDKNIKETIENVAGALKQGKNVFIFPEGTRTKDGNIGEFKKVFAILSKELNIPITCLKIDGAFNAYSRYMKIPRPKKIKVKYLGEVNPEGLDYTQIVNEAKNLYLDDK